MAYLRPISIAAALLVLTLGLGLLSCSSSTQSVKKDDTLAARSSATEGNKCISCHENEGITGSAVRDWKQSKHAAEDVTCDVCHAPETAADNKMETTCADKTVRREVSSNVCAECHEEQVAQFKKGKHSKAWVAMSAMPTTAEQPHAIIDGTKGCGGCHRIGLDEGKCDSCHTRHLFTAAEARRPEACATCHMGFDHPQWEMYSTSKHGTIYATQGDQWDWERSLSDLYGPNADPKAAARAPVCATCHMPDGDHGVRTAWGFLALRLPEADKEWLGYRVTILKALGVLDADGKPTARLDVVKIGDVARLTAEDWQKERDRMVEVCSSCHARSYAEAEMAKADELIKQSDKLVAEAITIVQSLYNDKILAQPKAYPMSVDLLRFHDVENPIEQKLFEMFLKHRMRSFQGAFHMNPDYQHWYGWAQMKKDLAEIRHEAAELRQQKKRRSRRR